MSTSYQRLAADGHEQRSGDQRILLRWRLIIREPALQNVRHASRAARRLCRDDKRRRHEEQHTDRLSGANPSIFLFALLRRDFGARHSFPRPLQPVCLWRTRIGASSMAIKAGKRAVTLLFFFFSTLPTPLFDPVGRWLSGSISAAAASCHRRADVSVAELL